MRDSAGTVALHWVRTASFYPTMLGADAKESSGTSPTDAILCTESTAPIC
jgi:hypothetical protein